MKIFIIAFLMILAGQICAETIQLSPLCKGEGKLLWYRILMIEDSVYALKEHIMTLDMDNDIYQEIAYLIHVIEYNLGYPTEVDEVGNLILPVRLDSEC